MRNHRFQAKKKPLISEAFRDIASDLVSISRSFYVRGWALGTSGNFSAVLSRDPLRLAITPSGADKGELNAERILTIGQELSQTDGVNEKPSAEALLHIRVVLERGAGAVFHTHSVWNTILSSVHSPGGGVMIEGFEMLKGLKGVKSHEHREWLPIIENLQDMSALAESVAQILRKNPNSHGFLLKQHGLYTWGGNLAEAKRHVEIFEFLLETLGRLRVVESKR
jgi:methylthioribulose-1-phosphate dehydratase